MGLKIIIFMSKLAPTTTEIYIPNEKQKKPEKFKHEKRGNFRTRLDS
jgi:hypothetical protein